jgi:hypothetical protein
MTRKKRKAERRPRASDGGSTNHAGEPVGLKVEEPDEDAAHWHNVATSRLLNANECERVSILLSDQARFKESIARDAEPRWAAFLQREVDVLRKGASWRHDESVLLRELATRARENAGGF